MRPLMLSRCPALMLLGALLLAPGAAAQTALINTPAFQLNDDGGLVSLGTFGTGTIPATGAGVRLMWHPAKAAFRAGSVNSSWWDEIAVGLYSTAMGDNTKAPGDWSTAMGAGTLASGPISTALGSFTTASGDQSTAMGGGTTASGAWSTAMGLLTTASGQYTTAMGRETTASGEYATAMGFETEANGYRSTAMGGSTTASGEYTTAMGEGTQASGNWSTAMGQDTQASGLYATAMGQDTQATGDWSVAMGEGTAAIGDRAIASGLDTIASGTYAATFGRETWASGILATALGRNTVAQPFASLVFGRYNIITGTTDAWISSEPVLVVGNGSGPATVDRSNALTLRKNGNLTIAGTLTQNSDRRLKRDLRLLTDAVAGLGQLQPVRYRFREGMNRPEGEHIGLVAQEVEAVFPALVSEGADGYLSVSYTNLVAVLVQALNEQQAEIETQQAGLEALRAEVAALRSTAEARPTPAVGAEQ